MANKELFKQAIAEAKSVREAAIANAKEALEESLTPHLKDMLAAKLQEMDDSKTDEEVVNEEEVSEEKVEESTEEVSEASDDDKEHNAMEEAHDDEEHNAMEEAEDDSEESEDDAEAEDHDADGEEEAEEDIEVKDMNLSDLKDVIRDLISQEVGGDEEEMGAELDGGDIDAPMDGAIDEPADEEEIDLEELLRELEGTKEVAEAELSEAPGKEKHSKDEAHDKEDKEANEEVSDVNEEELNEALKTINDLKNQLKEVNTLNSKLLYVNKLFKANNLTESQKVNVIAAFDKAETVKEVKLVYETVAGNIAKPKNSIKENKGLASKATGTTAKKPEVIAEANDAVRRMQKLAGII